MRSTQIQCTSIRNNNNGQHAIPWEDVSFSRLFFFLCIILLVRSRCQSQSIETCCDLRIYEFRTTSRKIGRKFCCDENWKRYTQLYLVSTVELTNEITATHTHTANKTSVDSVLACCRHKHNFSWYSVVFRCVSCSKSLRNSSCAIQNLDAIRMNAYIHTTNQLQPNQYIRQPNKHQHFNRDVGTRAEMKKKSIHKCSGNFFLETLKR